MSAAGDVVRALFAAYRDGDIDAMVALCTDDATIRYVPMGADGEGDVRDVGRSMWSQLLKAFPDLTNDVRTVVDGGATQAAAEVVIGGTQAKEFAGIPSKGHRYSLGHGFFFGLAEGKISRIVAYWDNASFAAQLG